MLHPFLHPEMLHPEITQHYRETRDFACESKFLLSAAQAEQIQNWARRHLAADAHGGGEQGDQYRVSSVYFDTPGLDVFQRNASYGRSKYRIRRYQQAEWVFLERKTKTKVQVGKRRTQVHMRDLDNLVQLPSEISPSQPGYWFQRRLQLRGLKPVCQIFYERTARVANAEHGPCRLTLDYDLQAQASAQPQFASIRGTALLSGHYILELKYRYELPLLFRRLLNEFAPLPQRISKYRLAIETLGLLQGQPLHREVV